jgi:beta-lactamase superfamily II metal-dependent hydrolase
LIDGGEPNTGVVAYLESQGIKRLSLVVATHPHSDHIGGLVEVLKTFPVDKVVTDGESATTAIFEQFIDAIATAKAQFVEVKKGDTISFGGLTFNVMSSGGVSTNDMNQNSVVLRMTYAKTTFLFMGDAGKVVEPMLAGMDISADILKVGHHGSNTASGLSFLSQVNPKVAIYMAGLGNSYGHPAAAALANLKAVGAQIYGTDVNGTIIVTVDGSGYSIKTAKQGNPQAPPTVQPTQAAMPTVKATTASQPTPQPTQNSGGGSLSISVVSLTSPISKGATATLTIHTLAGAACTITVYYKSGPSSAAGLTPKNADSSGNVSWSWKVGSNTTAGNWSISVTSSLNGQQTSQTIPFTVK